VIQESSLAWVAVVIGAVSLFYYFSNKRTPTQPAQPRAQLHTEQANGVLQQLSQRAYKGWKVCITIGVITVTRDSELTVPQALHEKFCTLCQHAQVFVICKVSDEKSRAAIIEVLRRFGNHGLQRNNVLFTTTEKGCEAFCRQITPTLLITEQVELGSFLSKFLPFILMVGGSANATKQNISVCESLDVVSL
jgi:hypothetical protein